MRWPDVSILKPLSGIEARLSENIETYFNQDYPGDIQFVFGVQDPDDGAIPVIEALMRRYPQLDLHLVVNRATHGDGRRREYPSQIQIQPNPAKPRLNRSKENQRKRL
jgi:ceramide glucosyltransferase